MYFVYACARMPCQLVKTKGSKMHYIYRLQYSLSFYISAFFFLLFDFICATMHMAI